MNTIFDLNHDNEILRLPFIPIDYGVQQNGIMRKCFHCGNEYRQGDMKELGFSAPTDSERVYHDFDKSRQHSIFYCAACWFTNEISNASNWVG